VKALVIGGTGLISRGILKHLRAREPAAAIDVLSRRQADLGPGVRLLRGDRGDAAALSARFAAAQYDVVIDMIAFHPDDARATVAAFGRRCQHLLFCSTVCTYAPDVPGHVRIDEGHPLEPPTEYGRNKVACERVFEQAAEGGAFEVTILRPSQTYGPGGTLIDQLEIDGGTTWDRVARGEPVLCTGDGLGLWQATHRDDVGKLFAYAALNPTTYGQAYNATVDRVFTWRDYYREAARALGGRASVLFVPARWLLAAATPGRFGLLRDVTRFHGAYTSAKARADVPEFRPEVAFVDGARETLEDVKRRGAWRDSTGDAEYTRLVAQALAAGFTPEAP
jgi:nucleoside-diphosphate-sugar epimerase